MEALQLQRSTTVNISTSDMNAALACMLTREFTGLWSTVVSQAKLTFSLLPSHFSCTKLLPCSKIIYIIFKKMGFMNNIL